MRIVVLDGHTLNPGDLTWAGLEALGPCTVHDRTLPEETLARAAGAGIVLTNKTLLPAATIEALSDLRYIGVLATGYNVVDIAAAAARGIPVTNTPAYGSASVAQMTFAHILNLTQRVAHHAGTVAEGRWTRSPDFCYWDHLLTELHGLTLGIIGFGRIGREVGRVGRAFGMRILAHDCCPPDPVPEGCQMVDLDRLFAESDVVTLHCPLTDSNRGLIDAARLGQMKPSALLINTSRGPLVDEAALAEALNQGRIAGAGLDVLAVEPPDAGNPLLRARNCFITPHIAWATRAARERLMHIAVRNVEAFLAGRPENVVNGV